MASLKLIEITLNLIQDKIQAEIAVALAQVSVDRADNMVTLDPPLSYFQYTQAHAYRAPAVFTIGESFSMRLPETNPNFINGLAIVNVAVVVEDKDASYVTVKAWRYQAALTKILHEVQMLNLDSSVKLVSKVMRTTFSSIYPRDKDEDDPDEVFRKEVVVELEVEHYENIQT